MLGAVVVDDGKPRRRRARSQCFLRGGQQRLQPRVTVALLPHRLGVEAEDHVVDEDRSVDLADVDAALDTVREGLERPDGVAALRTEIAREVVSGARGNARERQVVRARGRATGLHPSAARNRSPALIAHAPVAADSGGAEPRRLARARRPRPRRRRHRRDSGLRCAPASTRQQPRLHEAASQEPA
jgi:hypothetical protein